jgi:hypothetical protein
MDIDDDDNYEEDDSLNFDEQQVTKVKKRLAKKQRLIRETIELRQIARELGLDDTDYHYAFD